MKTIGVLASGGEPSSALALPMEIAGMASSFVIVPVPVAVAIDAFVAPDRSVVNDSFGSKVVSPSSVTRMSFVVSPAANVSVPFAAT